MDTKRMATVAVAAVLALVTRMVLGDTGEDKSWLIAASGTAMKVWTASTNELKAMLREPAVQDVVLTNLFKHPSYEVTDAEVEGFLLGHSFGAEGEPRLPRALSFDLMRKCLATARLFASDDGRAFVIEWLLGRKDRVKPTISELAVYFGMTQGDVREGRINIPNGQRAQWRSLSVGANPVCRLVGARWLRDWCTAEEMSDIVGRLSTDEYYMIRYLAIGYLDALPPEVRKRIARAYLSQSERLHKPDIFQSGEDVVRRMARKFVVED